MGNNQTTMKATRRMTRTRKKGGVPFPVKNNPERVPLKEQTAKMGHRTRNKTRRKAEDRAARDAPFSRADEDPAVVAEREMRIAERRLNKQAILRDLHAARVDRRRERRQKRAKKYAK